MLGPTENFAELLDDDSLSGGRRLVRRQQFDFPLVRVFDQWAREALRLSGIYVERTDFIGATMFFMGGDGVRRQLVKRDKLYARCRPEEARSAIHAMADVIHAKYGGGSCWFTAGTIVPIYDFDDRDVYTAYGDPPELYLRCYYGHHAAAIHA